MCERRMIQTWSKKTSFSKRAALWPAMASVLCLLVPRKSRKSPQGHAVVGSPLKWQEANSLNNHQLPQVNFAAKLIQNWSETDPKPAYEWSSSILPPWPAVQETGISYPQGLRTVWVYSRNRSLRFLFIDTSSLSHRSETWIRSIIWWDISTCSMPLSICCFNLFLDLVNVLSIKGVQRLTKRFEQTCQFYVALHDITCMIMHVYTVCICMYVFSNQS